MAWRKVCPMKDADENPYHFWEELTLEQLPSDRPGCVKLKITSNAKMWRGGTIVSRVACIKSAGAEIRAESAFRDQSSANVFVTDSVELILPNEYIGRSVTVSGRIYEWVGVILDPVPAFALTLVKNEHVERLSAVRTDVGTDAAEPGTLNDGAIIYAGDVLEIAAAASTGWEIKNLHSPVTVSGDVYISPIASPLATVSVFISSWKKYLWEIYSGGRWELYRAMIYSGGKWHEYY